MLRAMGGLVLVVAAAGTVVPRLATPPADAAPPLAALSTDEIEDRIVAATDRVVSFGCGLASNSGSAVVVAGGPMLTNRHVADGAVLINVVPELGRTAVARGRMSPSDDLAVLDVPTAGRTGLPLADTDPEAGEALYVAGYIEGHLGLTIERTRLVDYAEGASRGHHGEVMRVDYQVQVGMSGGPVVDRAGRLAGLVYAVELDTGYGLAIPASRLGEQLAADPFVPSSGCPAVAAGLPVEAVAR